MSTAERSEVRYGLTLIPYAIKRSARRATVSIFVDPTEGVLLAAPKTTSIERLDRVVHQKARWIVERLKRQSDLPPPMPTREFVSGETFLYLGKQYRLRVERGGTRVALVGGRLVVRTPLAASAMIRNAVIAWYRAHADARILERVAARANRMRIPTPPVIVREQSKRWGSCDARGVVRINWRIIQAPIRLVDYVVAHELVHLVHRAHDAAYWAELGRVMPDYEVRRASLSAIGGRLEW